jgi:hypothetical protein
VVTAAVTAVVMAAVTAVEMAVTVVEMAVTAVVRIRIRTGIDFNKAPVETGARKAVHHVFCWEVAA